MVCEAFRIRCFELNGVKIVFGIQFQCLIIKTTIEYIYTPIEVISPKIDFEVGILPKYKLIRIAFEKEYCLLNNYNVRCIIQN